MTNKPDLTKVWAENADPTDIKNPDLDEAGKFQKGWLSEIPPHTWFNYIQNNFSAALAHFNEYGIAQWDADTVYPVGGWARSTVDGYVYFALSAQSGNEPSASPTHWKSLNVELKSGRKNYIMNGQFNVAQRGSGPFTAPASSGAYTADRWKLIESDAGSSTVNLIISGDQNPVYLQATLSPGTTQAIVEQRIEDHQDFNGQDVVASFDLWGPSGGQVVVDLLYFNGTSFTLAAPTLVDFTTTRSRYTVNLTGPAFTAKTANSYIALRFLSQTGPTVTLNLDNVQLEKGTVATDFEYRPIGEELALCQRYYQQLNYESLEGIVAANKLGASIDYYGWVDIPTMRVQPVATVIGSTQTVFGDGSVDINSASISTRAGRFQVAGLGAISESSAIIQAIEGGYTIKLDSEL